MEPAGTNWVREPCLLQLCLQLAISSWPQELSRPSCASSLPPFHLQCQRKLFLKELVSRSLRLILNQPLFRLAVTHSIESLESKPLLVSSEIVPLSSVSKSQIRISLEHFKNFQKKYCPYPVASLPFFSTWAEAFGSAFPLVAPTIMTFAALLPALWDLDLSMTISSKILLLFTIAYQ